MRRPKTTPYLVLMKPGLAAKVGSILVHVEEALSLDGRDVDWQAVFVLMNDPEVKAWIKELGTLVPRKRR